MSTEISEGKWSMNSVQIKHKQTNRVKVCAFLFPRQLYLHVCLHPGLCPYHAFPERTLFPDHLLPEQHTALIVKVTDK